MANTFTLKQKIRFSHCDPAGILYFPHFFDFVNAAVEDWFELGLGVDFEAFHFEDGMGNPVVSTQGEFAQACRFGEELTIELGVLKVGRSSLEFRIAGKVDGVERMRARHKTAMVSLREFRAIPIPEDLRAKAETYLIPPGTSLAMPPQLTTPRASPANAFRARQLIRYNHCDPGGIVYYARFFDLFNAALEDWFAQGLDCPWGSDLLGTRDLRTPSLGIRADFQRACRLGEMLEFDIWPTRLGRSTMQLALRGSVAGEERMRVAWTVCMTSHRTFTSVPIPEDLRARMQRYLAAE